MLVELICVRDKSFESLRIIHYEKEKRIDSHFANKRFLLNERLLSGEMRQVIEYSLKVNNDR
jgi:hypothetical protein